MKKLWAYIAGLIWLWVSYPVQADSTLRIGITAMPSERGNPFGGIGTTSNFVLPAVYDRLFTFDDAGTLQPQLAESWKRRDALTWVIRLRKDIDFSNGEHFDAIGAKSVLTMLLTPEATPFLGARETRLLAGFDAEDRYTLILRTKEPNALLPSHFFITPMVPAEYLKKVGFTGLASNPIGSGPFTVENWTPERIVMKANPTSWRKPKVQRLEFLVLPEPMTRIQAIETGRIDVAIAIDPEQIDALKQVGAHVHQRKPMRVLSMVFNTLAPGSPFQNEKVRQAVNYGVNREAITKTLLAGLVEPASQGSIPGAHGYNDDLKPYPYDPDKARALLKEAGFGKGLSFTVEFPSGTLASSAAFMQQIAADLGKIGVQMNIQPITYAQFTRYFQQGGWKGQAFLADYMVYSMDGLRPFYRSTHSCDWSAPWFCDRKIQPLIDAAGVELDLDKRAAMTRQVLKYYRDSAESLLLFPILGIDAIGPRVTHWETWNDIIQFSSVTVADN